MKTIINEKTNKYILSFDSRKELEEYAWVKHFSTEYKTALINGFLINKSVEISSLDSVNLYAIFMENGIPVSRTCMPIEFLRQYDEIIHRAFVHLSNVMVNE